MSKLRKALLYGGAIVGWVFLLWFGGCAILPHWQYGRLARELNRIASPDGRYDAVVIDHPAPPYASGRGTVSIVPAGRPHDGKNSVLTAYDCHWSQVQWTGARELTIVHPAFEPVLHYEPIWPCYPRLGMTTETIRVILTIDHEKDSLNKVHEDTARKLADPQH